jgi:multidrug resistance efflux pump
MQQEKQIFPKEIIENSVEKHFADYNPSSRILYLSILTLFAIGFLLLFIIRVDVSVRSAGIIRPVQERTDLRAPVNGVIDSVFVAENQHVLAGQPLIKIHSQSVDEKNIAISSQSAELKAQYADLQRLLNGDDGVLESQLYQQQHSLYRQRLTDAQLKLSLVSREYNRFASLYRSNAISAAEFDKYSYEYRNAQTDLSLVKEQQRSQWQADLSRLEIQLREIGALKTAYEEEKSLYTIKASVTGTVQGLKSVAPGTFVSSSEILGEVSPDSGLIAEAHVATKDIGMLRPGAPVKMQVDAFDYNLWGSLKGRVVSVSEDVFTESGRSYFKVRCAIDRPVLHLSNGLAGTVKKGMSIQARFIVARRSLFQLLWDDTSDWLNPNAAPLTNATVKTP